MQAVQALQAHQALPPESWEPFGKAVQLLLDDLNAAIAKAEWEGPGPARAARNELKLFPSCTLSHNRDSKRRDRHLNTLLRMLFGGEKLQAPDTKKLSGNQKRAQKRKWDQQLA